MSQRNSKNFEIFKSVLIIYELNKLFEYFKLFTRGLYFYFQLNVATIGFRILNQFNITLINSLEFKVVFIKHLLLF
jgi:hypothetical protein